MAIVLASSAALLLLLPVACLCVVVAVCSYVTAGSAPRFSVCSCRRPVSVIFRAPPASFIVTVVVIAVRALILPR